MQDNRRKHCRESTVEKLKSVKQIRKGYTDMARGNPSPAMPSIMFHSMPAFKPSPTSSASSTQHMGFGPSSLSQIAISKMTGDPLNYTSCQLLMVCFIFCSPSPQYWRVQATFPFWHSLLFGPLFSNFLPDCLLFCFHPPIFWFQGFSKPYSSLTL